MKRRDFLLVLALVVFAFGLAAQLVPQLEAARSKRERSGNLLAVLFGDGRRLFANHFFLKADVYFHSGFYPTIFDTQEQSTNRAAHMAADTGAGDGPEKEMEFMGPPRDWIEAFGRNFIISEHTHLDQQAGAKCAHCQAKTEPKSQAHEPAAAGEHQHDHKGSAEGGGRANEMLPWLRLSAELDPQRVETYVVGAYWLSKRLGRVHEAEQFLREGLRENPDSPEILFELGRIQTESRNSDPRARNLWELALAKWQRFEATQPEPNKFTAARLHAELSQLEIRAGNLPQALAHLEALKSLSPQPEAVQKQINELRQKLPASPRP